MNLSLIKAALAKTFVPEDYFVFLFGSRAKGHAKKRSDWDIGVLADKRVRPSVMLRAREDLERIRTLDRFDLVDFSMTSPEFRKNVSKTFKPLIGDSKKWIRILSKTP